MSAIVLAGGKVLGSGSHVFATGSGGGGGGGPPGGSFNLFISTTGSDSNNGTLGSPWAITSLQAGNSNNSLIAGKNIGLISGTYNISSLTGDGNFTDPILNLPTGTSSARTYIGSCNTSGVYSARASTILITSANVGVNPVIGQNASSGSGGFWTIDGIVIDGGGTFPGTFGFSGGSLIAYEPSNTTSAGQVIIQNCEFRNLITNAGAGTNIAFIFMQGVANYIVTNNFFHDAYRPADPFHTHCFENYLSTGGTISFNTFYNTPYFLDAKLGNSNIQTYGNYFGFSNAASLSNPTPQGACMGFDNGEGLSFANVANVFHHNVFDSCGQARLNDVGTFANSITWYNNTSYDARTATSSCVDLFAQGTAGSPATTNLSTVYNNIIVAFHGGPSGYGNFALGTTTNVALENYNCFAMSSLANFIGTGGDSGTSYNSLSVWQATSGSPDAQSIASTSTTFPQFSSTITAGGANGPNQFQLGGSSPCLNAGKTGGTSGGSATNMGAWDGTYTTIGANWVSYPVS
jgi:hypothetical protein